MDNRNYSTGALWRVFMWLVSGLLFTVIMSLLYLILEDDIQSYLNKPSYSKEQLEKYSSSRDRQRKQERSEDWNLVENGIHVKTGLKADKDLQIIIQACTSCHSAKLITQNRATREGWKNMIVWMQATQGLPDLGSREPVVLDYLARHYAPKEEGRRANLDIATIEWYILNLE